MSDEFAVDGRKISAYGELQSGNIFLQPVDGQDTSRLNREAEKLGSLCGHTDWGIIAVPVGNWNDELTPWPGSGVSGGKGFGGRAEETLSYICGSAIPFLNETFPEDKRRYYLCGYSLAGLFALWGASRTDIFSGIAAASPSVWYPGWREYAGEYPIKCAYAYLSLGTKEEKTRNKTMAAVGDAVRYQYLLLSEAGAVCTLDWNEGNHFTDCDGRMAKGLAWLLKQQENGCTGRRKRVSNRADSTAYGLTD